MRKLHYKVYSTDSRKYEDINDLRDRLVEEINNDLYIEDIISLSEEIIVGERNEITNLEEYNLKIVVYYRAM